MHIAGAKGFPCVPGPYSQYSDWLEICPIVNGRVQLTNIPALKGKGQHFTCPLGVAPGAVSRMQGIMIHACCLSQTRALSFERNGWVCGPAARHEGPVSRCCSSVSINPYVTMVYQFVSSQLGSRVSLARLYPTQQP